MTLIAVPNVSEGRDLERLDRLRAVISASGARALNVHTDEAHNRSVLTVTAAPQELRAAMVSLASAASEIDLRRHTGVHPRLGGLDVCPFVAIEGDPGEAVDVARQTARGVAETIGLPVYLYGDAALREGGLTLPEIRSGGLPALERRAQDDLPPDYGPRRVDPARGVICVGARAPLVAFNVSLRCPLPPAEAIAREVRTAGGGPRGIRALAWEIAEGSSQVSMNLTEPDGTSVDLAFDLVDRAAAQRGIEVAATELVGLPLNRHLPDPQKRAARLLIKPGRSLESALEAVTSDPPR